MTSLVVLVAPAPTSHVGGSRGPGVLGGIRDVLQDWSAAELVGPFLWVETDETVGPRVEALEIVQGQAQPVVLQQLLAARQHDRVRLCILVPALGSAPMITPEVESRLAELVSTSAGASTVERLRCIVTRPDSGPAAEPSVVREGWHNLLISPEDSRGPGLGHQLLEPSTDPITIGPHAAATVCGLTGLWRGIDEAPLDDTALQPGQTVRVARSFYRRLDASDVEQVVRDGVTSMTSGLPRPRVGGGHAVYVEDVGLATSTMASSLWSKHQSVLKGPRVNAVSSEARDIGAIEALMMLFSFLGAAIKNAPARWYATLVHKASSKAAAAVHGSVFGKAPSAYEVVVNGTRPDGSPVDWRDIATASGQISDLIGQPDEPATHLGHNDLSPLWKDYVAGALTLADGGEHASGLAPVQVGVDRGVLRRPGDCAPGPDDAFTAIPPHLAESIGYTSLAATDVLGIHAVRGRLQQATQDPSVSVEAGRTLQELNNWFEHQQQSFAVQTGSALGRSVLDTTQEVRTLLQRLAEATNTAEDTSEAIRRKQRRLARWMRGLMIAWAVIMVVLIVLGGTETLEWSTVGWSCGGVTLAWLVSSFLVFLSGQRELFRELNRRREAASQAEANRSNLRQAIRDLRRVTAAYGQYLSWSQILGVVLARPFGDAPAEPAPATLLEGDLPLTTRLGIAEHRSEVSAQVVVWLRRGLFKTGWLSRPWEAVLADAHRRLGAEAIDLAEDPGRIFAEQAPQPGSGDASEALLPRWSDLLGAEGAGAVGSDALWSGVVGSLATTEQGRSLISEVRIAGVAGSARPWSEFMANVDSDPSALAGQSFDTAVFGAEARVAGEAAVVENWGRTAHQALSQVGVLVQLSEGIPGYQLALHSERPESTEQWQAPTIDGVF